MEQGKEKKRRKTKKIKQEDFLPDGTMIDLDSIDYGEVHLTTKQKRFIFWYTLPGQVAFKEPCKAAKKAGYQGKAVYTVKADILGNEKLKKIIDRIFDENIKTSLKEASQRVMNNLIKRAEYKVSDFYENIEYTNPDTGVTRKITVMKPFEEINPEAAELIDNVELSNSGMSYKLPNRESAQREILKLNNELNQKKSTGDYDIQTTVDLIKDNLGKVSATVRVTNQSIRESAPDYIENNENQPDFD